MLSREECKKLAERVISFSSFPECQVFVNSSEQAFIRFALNGITTSGFVADQSLSVSVTKDAKSGNSNVNEFDDKSLREAVTRAERLALISPPNPEDVPPLGPQKYASEGNFMASTAAARNPAMIPHVRAVIEGAKAKTLVAAGFFERTASSNALANKQGNFGYAHFTDASLSATVRTPDGSSSGWASQPSVRIEEINGEEVAKTAIEKCERWKNPKRLEPGKYTVVLEPTAVGDLVPFVAFSMSARAAEQGQSFLTKKGGGTLLGEKLFPETITLHSDPFDKRNTGYPWGGGGLPSEPMTWIEKGVVQNLFYDRYWAMKAGKKPTGGPGSLILDGGEKSLAELIASVDRGLLVTRFWYIRQLNPQTVQLTGLTRDGLFLIEGGKITSPVVNFRFNESPVRMLQNTIAMGKPIRIQGGESGMIAPPLVVKDFPFTSVSDAV